MLTNFTVMLTGWLAIALDPAEWICPGPAQEPIHISVYLSKLSTL